MNKLILMIVLIAGIISANAQPAYNAANANSINSNSNDNEEMSIAAKQNPLASVEFNLKNNIITFTGLPADKHLRAYISNADGEEEYNQKLSIQSNTIDAKQFAKGLHYITIITRDNKRKGFRLNL